MAQKQDTQTQSVPRAYCVRDGETGRVISWCMNRAEAIKAVARWGKRCERRKVPNRARIEEVKK